MVSVIRSSARTISHVRLRGLFGGLVWLVAVVCTALAPAAAQAQAMVAGQRTGIAEADQILRARVPPSIPVAGAILSTPSKPVAAASAKTAGSPTGCGSGSSFPVEIVTLASALKCDVDLIFEYVYDNIEYEPLFGSNKGALGTLLDQRGNDIDQAQLFVALLNAAGITQTSFQYGYITVTGPTAEYCPGTSTTPIVAPAPGWLGVKNDIFSIYTLLSNGGIPTGSGTYNGSDGTLVCLDVAHVWVQVDIGGTNYVFDPSFKQHTVSSGLANLGAILGYSQSQLLSDAGGTIDAVSISNINRARVRADLTAYANNLISFIKGSNPAATPNAILGGKTIIPLAGSPIRQTSLPYLSTNQPSGYPMNWGAAVPTAYRTCIAITLPITGATPTTCANAAPSPATGCATQTATPGPQTIVLYSDQTYGQRITVFSVPDPNVPGNFLPTLLVNGAAPSTGVNVGTSTASVGALAINASITHPYAGTGANQCRNLTVAVGGSYLISAGWGQVGRGMVEKHRQLLAQALAQANANPASEAVLGESLAIISYNWLAENAAQQQLGDAIGQTTTQYHHGVGITAQTQIQSSGNQGPYVDLPLNFLGPTSQTCWPQTTCPLALILGSFFTDSAASSSLESAVLEQTQALTPNMMAASTVRLVDINAAAGAKTFFADGTSASGVAAYFSSIRPNLTSSYSANDLSFIDYSISTNGQSSGSPANNQLLLPVNGHLSVGLWQGAGYTLINRTSTSAACLQKISGGLSGGFSGTNVPTPVQVASTAATISVPPASTSVPALINPAPAQSSPTWLDPIDAISGAIIYNHADIAVGGGSFPYALPFARTYRSSSNMADVGLGRGWTHSYSLAAAADSDPYEGFGASSPLRAAAAVAAIYVLHDLLSGSTYDAQHLTLAWIVVRWLTDHLTGNAAFITHPDTVEEFLALPGPDGATTVTYNPPLGSAVVLTGSGTGSAPPTAFRYATKDGTVLNFGAAAAGAITSWVAPSGMEVDFSYDGSGHLTTLSNSLGRRLVLSYAASTPVAHLVGVSDGTRQLSFSYAGQDLAAAADPLGATTAYSYDGADHLTQIFYPSNPGTPYVTNLYDGLGRVANQINAIGNASSFFFAGSRSEMADAAGDRHVTYQTQRGKVTKDVAVLSPSFGDVFEDTAQQNGVVNVASSLYDGQDRLVLATAPEGGTTVYGYSPDLLHNVISVTRNPKPGSPLAALTTTFDYDDPFGKPTRVSDPLGLVTLLSYDPVSGNLIRSVADAGSAPHLNATATFAYTAYGQLQQSVDPLGIVTIFTYDGFGNPVQTVYDAGGAGHLNQTTTLAYDATGDPVAITDPNGNVTTLTYDADRRRLTSLSPGAPNGVLTQLSYDADGRLLQSLDSLNGAVLRTVSSRYTPSGQLASTTDANGQVTRFAYDVADRLVSVTDPSNRLTTYAYDALSRRIGLSVPALQGAPLQQLGYTPDGLVASLTVARGTSSFSVTALAYDGFDRLASTTYPDASTEQRGYDADGNLLTRRTRAGQTIAFTYDSLNRLASKAPAGEATVSYAYDLAGRPIGIADTSAAIVKPVALAAPLVTQARYDALNRPLAYVFSPAPAMATGPPAGSATFAYSYNATNQRIGQSTTDIAFWSYPAASASTVSYTPNSLDQYTAVGSVTPTYDANGNLTFDGNFTYGYDTENRLIAASAGGATVATYAYDPSGNRKSKTVGSTTTVTVMDAGRRALLDYDGTSGAILRWSAFGAGPNDVLSQMNVAAGTRTTFVPDIQGSIMASLDSGSGVLTKAGYQPYGESASTAGSFRYTGARIDAETAGLYDFRARVYSPLLGRFLQPDPIGTAGGVNLYAYVANDPLNGVDPSGLVSEGAVSTTASQVDLDLLYAELTNARLAGDLNLVNQILAEIDNLTRAASGAGGGFAPVGISGAGAAMAAEIEATASNDTCATDGQCGTPQTLYHYTTQAGMSAILAAQQIYPSLLANNPNDVRYGEGQYLSDIPPGTMTSSQLSRVFIGMPFQGRRFTNYVGIDVRGITVVMGRPNVYVAPNTQPLDVTGRITGFGSN